LIGAWEFEKAFYKKDNALFRDNITGEYADDLMEFYGDYTAAYFDYSTGIVYPGDWQILTDRDYSYDSDGSNIEFFIDAVFRDVLPEGDFAFFGSIDRLNNDKLVFEARDRRGAYTFKLCKR
jgi:hypothetical protein